MSHHHGNHQSEHEHHVVCGTSLYEELSCHLPFAMYSVALSIVAVSVLTFMSDDYTLLSQRSYRLFHSLHFMHLLFAGTGVVLTFRKYSKSILGTLVVGTVVPAIFCSLSDAIMPYLGGKLLGLDMQFHWCLVSHIDTVLLLLGAGILNGWVISNHASSSQLHYSTGSHFVHIFISSMASILYLLSFGFTQWSHNLGFTFGFLLVAVLLPCTLSDLIVPRLCAGFKLLGDSKPSTLKGACSNDEKH